MDAESKKEKQKEKLAGYIYDLSKLTFAGLVIGGLTPLFSSSIDSVSWGTIILGGFTTLASAFFANRILK